MIKQSIQNLKSLKYLTLIAIFIALKIAISSIFIPVHTNLRIYFTFIISAVEACIVGPIPALVSGAISDILGFMLHPSGPFFFGYTISSMLGSLIFALFLYQTQLSIVKIASARLIINLGVNTLLGSLWSTILFSKGFIYYASTSLIKNLILLPIEVFILVLLFQALMPFLEKRKFIPRQHFSHIPWLTSSKKG